MSDPFDDIDLQAHGAQGEVRDPYPEYAERRRTSPVVYLDEWENGEGSWHVYRYDDVEHILRNQPEIFSSEAYAGSIETIFGPSFIGMDGHEHVVHRGLVASSFRRRALERWETTLIAPTARELIDRFAPRGRADLVRELTFPYPVKIFSRILGIPEPDTARFARLSIEMLGMVTNPERGLAASAALREYFAELLDERRRRPRDDLISMLASAEVEGHRLPDEHIFGFLRLLLPAGAETTYRLLGNVLFGLLTNEDQLKEVRGNRALLQGAIEEALRWEAPVQFIGRMARRDVELGGVRLEAGANLLCILGAANRDDTKYQDPDRFDLHRRGPAHLAFAEGPHRCLGEHLARLEVTVAMNALLDRLPDMRSDPAPGDDPHVRGTAFRSPTTLPVSFSPS